MITQICLVGSNDQELIGMLTPLCSRVTTIPVSSLPGLADPGAAQPDVLVLDLRDRLELPTSLQLLKRAHPTTPVVIVASGLDPILILSAMRMGVNECVTSPLTIQELEAAITRVAAQDKPAVRGEIYGFVGAKGGLGTTTTAVNVATALAKQAPSSTLFIDLHLSYGDAAEFFGVQPRFSVVDALENTRRIDVAVFRGLVVKTKAGVDLLASSERPTLVRSDAHRVRSLLDLACSHYHYTVLDVPRSDPGVLEALDLVSKIVLVVNQELVSVKHAGRLGSVLRERYGGTKIMTMLSRYDRLADIDRSEVERTLGSSIKHVLPSDWRVALSALNRGRPVTLDNHCALAAGYRRLAADLSDAPVASETTDERPGGLLERLKGRRS